MLILAYLCLFLVVLGQHEGIFRLGSLRSLQDALHVVIVHIVLFQHLLGTVVTTVAQDSQ